MPIRDTIQIKHFSSNSTILFLTCLTNVFWPNLFNMIHPYLAKSMILSLTEPNQLTLSIVFLTPISGINLSPMESVGVLKIYLNPERLVIKSLVITHLSSFILNRSQPVKLHMAIWFASCVPVKLNHSYPFNSRRRQTWCISGCPISCCWYDQ